MISLNINMQRVQEQGVQAAEQAGSRNTCPQCSRSHGPYCPDCIIILEQPGPKQLRLPVQVDIVQHGETNVRSTALHAALLAPQDVRLYRHAGSRTSRRCNPLDLELPDYDPASTVVLFPEGADTDVVGQCPPFQRVVVLESNWKKARGLLHHPKLAGLRRVQLPPGAATTAFTWRRGNGSFKGAVDEGLSSIEAIYYCCRLLGGEGGGRAEAEGGDDPGPRSRDEAEGEGEDEGRGGASPYDPYDSLLHYFRRTQRLVEARGPLPTSRQEARARSQVKQGQLDLVEQQQQQQRRQQQQHQQRQQGQQSQQQLGTVSVTPCSSTQHSSFPNRHERPT